MVGDYGVSLATVYFLGNGYQVLFPYGDRGRYDLVVEKERNFQRVQCKWTKSRKQPQGYYRVSLQLTTTHKKEDRSIGRKVEYQYTENDFDYLWVATPTSCYLIPSSAIFNKKSTKRDIKLYPKWDIYRISLPLPERSETDNHTRLSPRLTSVDKVLIQRLLKENKSYREIGNILNVSEGCISAQICRNKEFYRSPL